MKTKKISLSPLMCVLLAAMVLLFFGSLAGLFLAKVYQKSIPVPVYLPASGLSSSLFEQQNQKYVENKDKYPVTYEFGDLPYRIDTPGDTAARIGKAHIEQTSKNQLLYLTETNADVLSDSIRAEIIPGLLTEAEDEYTQIELAQQETGYMNGYYCTFMVLNLKYGKDDSDHRAYLVGYLVQVGDSDDVGILVSSVTTSHTTEGLKQAKTIASNELYRLRENPKNETGEGAGEK